MPKKLSNVQIATTTLAIIDAGYYKINNNVNVSIRRQVDAAVSASKMYSPEECEELKKSNVYMLNNGYTTEFHVWNCTTLEAAERLIVTDKEEKVLALNFASAKFPGGGFKTGAKAQEESLARSSALYHCLKKFPKFYSNNKRENNCIFTDNVIYSPVVPFFRRDNGDLLPNAYLMGVVSAPAIHYGNAHKKLKATTVLEDRMKQRAHYILNIAAQNEHDTLILGAWGCGVFKFPVDECAGIFWDLLKEEGAPFQYTFKKVVFAILKPHQAEVFEDYFNEEEGEEEAEGEGEGKGKEKAKEKGKRRERTRDGDEEEEDEDDEEEYEGEESEAVEEDEELPNKMDNLAV